MRYQKAIHQALADTAAVTCERVSGETFLYLGGVSLVNGQGKALLLKDGCFCLSRELIGQGGTDAARKAFAQFYTDKGQQRFPSVWRSMRPGWA